MKHILILSAITLLTITSYSQGQKRIDSLLTILKTEKEDSNKVNTLIAICNEKINLGDYLETRKYADEALAVSEKIGFRRGTADSYGYIGWVYEDMSDYSKALEYEQKALTINEELDNKKGIAGNYLESANVYYYLSDYPKALEYWQKALSIDEQLGNKNGVADILGNI